MKSEIEKNCLGKIYKTTDNSYTVIGDVVPHWKDGFCIVVQDNFGKKYKKKFMGIVLLQSTEKLLILL